MAEEFFISESGVLDLKTAKVTDGKTGKESCLWDWSKAIDDRHYNELQKAQLCRDKTSDIENLPGIKPYFGEDPGLIRRSTDNCGGSNYYSGLSGY